MDLKKFTSEYEKIRADRDSRINEFIKGDRNILVFQTPPGDLWGDVRTKEQCFDLNVEYIGRCLKTPSDDVPVMEPWFGTGIIPNVYGCPYIWRDGIAPAVHYKYFSMDDIPDIKKPDWRKGEIVNLVFDTIDYFKSQTGDLVPIVWTDTQSASDNASLILDASEFMIASMIEPDMVMKFMQDITDIMIDFSAAQAERIGSALISPGHIMLSGSSLKGISVSDDNIAVVSPQLARDFNLKFDQQIGEAFGGVAIHSCGKWDQVMSSISELVPSCVSIDCALSKEWDPSPNKPEDVRDALNGQNRVLHARVSGTTEEMLKEVEILRESDIQLIVHPKYIDEETAGKNYEILQEKFN